MTGQNQFQRYQAPGPIGAAYIESRHPISVIMGPGGSGKTVASAFKGPHLAANWFPICKDGVVRVKSTVLRTTYRDMARTALESWHSERLFPKNHPFTVHYEGGIDRPVIHRLEWATIRDRRRVKVEFTAQFAAIGESNPEQFVKGFETSFAWINECDLFAAEIPGLMFSRTGRYPAVDMISPEDLDRVMKPYRKSMAEAGIQLADDEIVLPRLLWGDCNPPDPDNWVVKNLVEAPDDFKLYKLFRQPSGLASNAENRIGKPRSSYEQDLRTMTPDNARRYVHGEPGYAKDGKPVYEREFAANVHRSDEQLRPIPQIPLSIGMDAGGSPAATISQTTPEGQKRILRELVCDPGTGATRFAGYLLDLLMVDFRGLPIRRATADPSSFYGADRAAGELSWVETVAKTLGIPIDPAPTNEVGLRHDCVRWFLGMIDVRTPRMLIDPRCRVLLAGFGAHYKLTKMASAGATDGLVVAKNSYSHVHDALQYDCLGERGVVDVIDQAARQNRGGGKNVVPIRGNVVPRAAAAGFNVWNV